MTIKEMLDDKINKGQFYDDYKKIKEKILFLFNEAKIDDLKRGYKITFHWCYFTNEHVSKEMLARFMEKIRDEEGLSVIFKNNFYEIEFKPSE